MTEFIHRLLSKPLVSIEIFLASFLITVLALAMPLYVIQILSRYVTYGFHGTLITLTSGMLLAIILQLGFRVLRTKMATVINQEPNDKLSWEVLNIVAQSKAEPLEQFSKPRTQEALNNLQIIQSAYDAQTLTSIIDVPFSLLFIAATYLLSPILAGVSLISVILGLFMGWLSMRKSQQNSEQLLIENAKHRNLNFSAVTALDTVRAFCAVPFLQKLWQDQLSKLSGLRGKMTDTKEMSQTMTISGSSLSSVLLYAVGATIVVQGDLTVGALIGANILASRAYQNVTKLVQVSFLLSKAKNAYKDINLLRRMPLESSKGSALKEYNGQIEFQDVGFAYPNTNHPVFESLTLKLPPGKAMAVYGQNGTGKSTLAKLLLGLLEPRRGSILADNVNIQQLAYPWWRNQIIYMPQEPTFLNGTIRENLLLLNPEIDETIFNRILKTADLKTFLNGTPNGLDTLLSENGKNLPLGIRRRLSLARGLVSDGQVVILDEPTDALDDQGTQAIYNLLNVLIKAQKTIIVFSNDPKILKGVSLVLNLNIKPTPELTDPLSSELRGISH